MTSYLTLTLISYVLLHRCYLPSGKVLWLCPEHQKIPRVTLLEDADFDGDYSEIDTPEASLLQNLRLLQEPKKVKLTGEIVNTN